MQACWCRTSRWRRRTASAASPARPAWSCAVIRKRGRGYLCKPDQGACAYAGLLVPDIPLEETDGIRRIASAAGLELCCHKE